MGQFNAPHEQAFAANRQWSIIRLIGESLSGSLALARGRCDCVYHHDFVLSCWCDAQSGLLSKLTLRNPLIR